MPTTGPLLQEAYKGSIMSTIVDFLSLQSKVSAYKGSIMSTIVDVSKAYFIQDEPIRAQ